MVVCAGRVARMRVRMRVWDKGGAWLKKKKTERNNHIAFSISDAWNLNELSAVQSDAR